MFDITAGFNVDCKGSGSDDYERCECALGWVQVSGGPQTYCQGTLKVWINKKKYVS